MDIREGDRQILEDRKTVFDRIDDIVTQSDGEPAKPLRKAIERSVDQIPTGPLGKLGEGNIVAGGAYVAIRSGQLAVLPIPGARQPGFHAISHGVESRDGFERHTVRINAASRKVAEVAAEYQVASPSNIDYVSSEIETVEVNELTSRTTYSTWEYIVDVADRGQKNE